MRRPRLIHFRLAAVLVALAVTVLLGLWLIANVRTDHATSEARAAANRFLSDIRSGNFAAASEDWCSTAVDVTPAKLRGEVAQETVGLERPITYRVTKTSMDSPHRDLAMVNFIWASQGSTSRHEVAVESESGVWRVCGLV